MQVPRVLALLRPSGIGHKGAEKRDGQTDLLEDQRFKLKHVVLLPIVWLLLNAAGTFGVSPVKQLVFDAERAGS